ncbi:LacI family DNA-binding transcriptional regulator [Microbacterium sp. SSW1-59]|uniref:LacI family DNA-binding transcriptional regulator n=1 Tax=Microbacterium xanthum TaxID=3079794 RepID=UPI002AD4C6FA|nr:LacI family DNA-binding transcriptional regulator [Microbacterium sp. SSW1-59]MDZ8200371.1 LacI family DNA-binding transcriptional regulator [Microbacterium sp. SSW1-59]
MGDRVTIQEVAAAAGVSASSVSNLLNGRTGKMVPATRERIERAIADLGYRPNRAARQLRSGRTQTLGLVVPSVGNPFWGAFAREVEVAALALGCNVLLCNSERDPDRERRYVEELWEDGIRSIILCTSLPSLDHVSDVIGDGLRLVTFDRPAQPNDPASVISISIDNNVGGQIATSHLLGLGHEKIAFVSGSIRSVNRAARYRGYCDAIEAAGLAVADMPSWTGFGAEQFGDVEAAQVGRAAAHALLAPDADRPTAIVAVNDMTALGFCRGARDMGLVVGEDVSVIGFDGIILAELYDPPLTSVRQPIREMARLAVGEAVQAGVGADGAGRSVLLRPEIVLRESTYPPRSAATARVDATSGSPR